MLELEAKNRHPKPARTLGLLSLLFLLGLTVVTVIITHSCEKFSTACIVYGYTYWHMHGDMHNVLR